MGRGLRNNCYGSLITVKTESKVEIAEKNGNLSKWKKQL